MSSSYPSSLDSFATNLVTGGTVLPATDNDSHDAINKIEAELGTNPSGQAATVKARLDNGLPLYNVKDYGAVGNGSTDDTTAVQAAITACDGAGGGIVYYPAGTYKITATLTVPTATQFIWQGTGMRTSIIQAPSDLGAGVFAVDKTGTTSQKGSEFRDLQFQGSGGTGSPTVGTKPSNNDGINLGGDWKMRGCEVVGWRMGVTMAEDHSSVENCRIKNNWGNVYFPNGPIRTDNHYFKKCELTVPALASVIVGGNNARLAQTHFDHCHFGFGPWCFYREAHTAGVFCSELLLSNPTFEQYGNGVFGDETFMASAASSGSVAGLRIVMGIASQSDTYKYTTGGDGATGSKVVIAPWNVRKITGLRVFGGAGAVSGGFPAKLVAANTTLINCDTIVNSDLGDMSKLIVDLQAASKPAMIAASNYYGNWCQNFVDGTVAVQNECQFWLADAAVTQYDAMQAKASSSPQCTQGTTGIPIGVAQHALSATGLVPVAYRGRTPIRITGADGTTASLTKLKLDSGNAGRVTAVAAGTDLPKVGYSVAANASSLITSDLMLTL